MFLWCIFGHSKINVGTVVQRENRIDGTVMRG